MRRATFTQRTFARYPETAEVFVNAGIERRIPRGRSNG
jgi:hypothetical protein